MCLCLCVCVCKLVRNLERLREISVAGCFFVGFFLFTDNIFMEVIDLVNFSSLEGG